MEQWIIVRDNKPQLPGWLEIWKSRKVIDDKEHQMYLVLKIDEETQEVLDACKTGEKHDILEELCDIYEITLCLKISRDDFCHRYPAIDDIVKKYGFTWQDIDDRAEQKRITHGSFQEGILLDLQTVLNPV